MLDDGDISEAAPTEEMDNSTKISNPVLWLGFGSLNRLLVSSVITDIRGQASSSSNGYYDVFLSFRGKDTRTAFTDHLYRALIRQGFVTFRDDDAAEKGENLKSELEKAIRQSKSSILVLSKDYASSPWCLDELVTILNKKRNSELNRLNDPKHQKHEVLPVFYDVKPSHLRKQTGTIAESFLGYEKQIEEQTDPEKKRDLIESVKRWRSALAEITNLIGLELQNNEHRHEAKFIEKIVIVIRDKLRRAALYVAPYEIGMDYRAKSINTWLQDKLSNVNVIAICGMGGIGKTTIAKYVYNQSAHNFDGSSFLADINEVSKQHNGVVCLQTQLLSDISRSECGRIYNVHEGIAKVKNILHCKKVLLVLDDVDQADQIQGICGLQEKLFPGSKIIITTRRERLLKPHQVYKVNLLSQDESIKLFSLHAFGEERPSESYIKHTERAVQICEGLPLALTVLGSSMSAKSEDEWIIELQKLEAVPQNKILEKLKTSFSSLQDDYDRRLFLHIACFFVGTNKDFAIKVLEKCVDYANVGIQNLIDRCLIRVEFDNILMHKSIQDMGREIVNQESVAVGERTRLWRSNDAFSVLRNETGTKKVEGLAVNMLMLNEDGNNAKKRRYEELYGKSIFSNPIRSIKRRCVSFISGQSVNNPSANSNDVCLRAEAFMSMKNLRVLKLINCRITGSYKKFPKLLVLLSWYGCPLKAMPVELKLENLVALDLQHSTVEHVWKETPFLESLKILNLSYSESLTRTPNFLGLPNLETLMLKGCVNLIEVCESIKYLDVLQLLDLRDCKALRELPRNIDALESLKTLLISGSNIHELSSEMKNMKSLQVLDTSGIIMNPLKDNGKEEVKWWQRIVWSVPRKLGTDTFSASLPCLLENLNMSMCGLSDDTFSMNFRNINLPLLRVLKLVNNPLQRLENIKNGFNGLQLLDIRNCNELKSLDLSGFGTKTTFIYAFGCGSLENITWPIGNTGISFGSRKLGQLEEDCFEKASAQEFNIARSKFCVQQALLENGVYSLFFEGEGSLKFSGETRNGSAICFTVPSGRIQYLAVWCSIEKSSAYIRLLSVEIKNGTKGLAWKYFPDFTYCHYRLGKTVKWWSRWRFGNQLEAGDEITVRFDEDYHELITECGFKLVCGDLEEEDKESRSSGKSHHDFPELQPGVPSRSFWKLFKELLDGGFLF